MTKNNKEQHFRGSIDARKDPIFEEEYHPSRIQWSWEGDEIIKGELTPACFTKPLKKLFYKLGVDFETIQLDKTILKSEIDLNIDTDNLAYVDSQRYVRIRYSGMTDSEFDERTKAIQEYLTEHNIPYKSRCRWECDDPVKQTELKPEYSDKKEEVQ